MQFKPREPQQSTLTFIGVPIRVVEDDVVGVFAVQPPVADDLMPPRARLAVMVANLVGHAVRLSRSVEAERRALREERDTLRRQVKSSHGFDNIIGRTEREAPGVRGAGAQV